MHKGFHPENGPLANKTLVVAEREAEMHPFAGAIGTRSSPTHPSQQRACPKSGHTLYSVSELKTEDPLSLHSRFPIAGHFPIREVETCIRETLDAQQSAQQVLRPRAGSACEPEIDSLVVVEVLCAVEELLGVTLPTSFAPRGGYDDVEACVSDLLAETRAVWVELVKQMEEHDA